MTDAPGAHRRLLEAILFAAAEAVPERVLARRLPAGVNLPALLEELRADYANRGVNLVRAGSAWAFRTAPDLAADFVRETEVSRKLSRAAVETLAIIAYHQPVTRAEIEEIRGVGLSKGTLDALFEAGWVRPKGRRRTPGRPVTWGTTDAFLDHFGLESLDHLPGIEELRASGLLETGPAIEGLGDPGAGEPAAADAGEESPEAASADDPDSEPPEGDDGGGRVGDSNSRE